MNWETPSFVEVNMDAEINSYQDDFRDTPDVKERLAEVPVTITTQE
jgi:coenzyme PQQ precursor peptide PqqA